MASSFSSVRVEEATGGTKLPIYSAPPEPVRIVKTTTRLEGHVSDAREAITASTQGLRNAVHDRVSHWIGVERKVEKQVLKIIPDDEPLTPGLIYVGVATLAGSVFGRYRSFPIRVLSPPLFLLGSLNYFLPKTAHNLSQFYQQIEAAHLPPAIKEQREKIVGNTRSLWRQADDKAHVAARVVEGEWKEGLDLVQKSTGLKVGPSHGGTEVVQIRAPPGTEEARQE